MPENGTHRRRVASRSSKRTAAAADGADTGKSAGQTSGTTQRYRLLFEHSLAGVYCTNLDGQILDCNESAARMLGYSSREELLSHKAQDLYLTPADREAFLARLRSAGVLVNSELRLRRKDGTPVDILENVLLLPGGPGEPCLVQGTMVDITERKRTEEALRESQAALAAVFHNAPVMMLLLDGDRRVRQANRAAQEVADRPGGDLEGLSFGNAVRCINTLNDPDGCGLGPACQECPVRRIVSHTFETGRSCYQEEARLAVSGDPAQRCMYLLLSTSRLELPDDHGVLVCIQDITERKEAEEALRESEQRYRALADDLRRLTQRLQSVRERERARIARELHDELGQALTALNMDLHWLKGRSGQDSEAAGARIASMCGLVNGTIQAVHRICSDLRPSVLDDFGLTAAIEWQARDFQERTGITCRVSLPAASPALSDEQTTAVFRIFQESLTNIARHARATQAEVTLHVDSGALVLSVADNGIGIAKDKLAGMQSLGLAGVRERAVRWGGRVEISGTARRGTTVTLHMPIEQDGAEYGT